MQCLLSTAQTFIARIKNYNAAILDGSMLDHAMFSEFQKGICNQQHTDN